MAHHMACHCRSDRGDRGTWEGVVARPSNAPIGLMDVSPHPTLGQVFYFVCNVMLHGRIRDGPTTLMYRLFFFLGSDTRVSL